MSVQRGAMVGVGALVLVCFGCASSSGWSDRDSGGQGGSGVPVSCSVDADCPGENHDCQTQRCAGGLCVTDLVPDGTPVEGGVYDCSRSECDGEGNMRSIPDDTDVQSDGKGCTEDSCSEGTPVHTPAAPGTTCDEDGGSYCDAAGACSVCPPVTPACDDLTVLCTIAKDTCSEPTAIEPNDTESAPFDLGTMGDSDGFGLFMCGVLRPGDVDWFTYQGVDTFGAEVDPARSVTSQGVRVCKFLECTATTPLITCQDGSAASTSPLGVAGCCGSGSFSVGFGCEGTDDDNAKVLLQVSALDPAACTPYEISFHY